MEVFLAGVGMTSFGKKEQSLQELMGEAVRAALKDASVSSVDAIYVGVMSPTAFLHEGNFASLLADFLGMAGKPSLRIETASSTGAAAFLEAYNAVAAGQYTRALVVAGEKMSHLSTSETTRILSEVIDREERRYGATMPALAGLVAHRYMYEHHLSQGTLEKLMSAIAIKNHSNGLLNPYAHLRKAIDEQQHRQSRLISSPLRLFDCAPISDGAAAVVLTCERGDIRVAGIGHGTDTYSLCNRRSLTSFASTRIAAQKAYRMARLSPHDIDFAEIHDAFTIFELIGMVDLGFFSPAEAREAVLRGETGLRGRFPVNPSGGLKSRGHPVGGSGLAQIVEVALQLRGAVEKERQVKIGNVGLAHSVGGLATNTFVTILEKTSTRRNLMLTWSPHYDAEAEVLTPIHPLAVGLASDTGILETFTVLHTPPEGFPSPMVLGLVREPAGNRIFARGVGHDGLKMNRQVYLRHMGSITYFTQRSLWYKAKVLCRKNYRKYNRKVNSVVQGLMKKAS